MKLVLRGQLFKQCWRYIMEALDSPLGLKRLGIWAREEVRGIFYRNRSEIIQSDEVVISLLVDIAHLPENSVVRVRETVIQQARDESSNKLAGIWQEFSSDVSHDFLEKQGAPYLKVVLKFNKT